MIAQLVIGLVVFAALGGAFLSWKHDIRAEGEQRAVKEYEKQQLAAAQENERINAEGKAAVLRLLADAEQRNRKQASELDRLRGIRQIASDVQASKDTDYAQWRDSAVPTFAADRLRQYAELAPAPTRSSRVPKRITIPPEQGIPTSTEGETDESPIGRIRAFLDRTGAAGMGSGGAGK